MQQTPEEIFDNAMKHSGGRFDTAWLTNPSDYELRRGFAESIIRRTKNNPAIRQSPPIHFDYYKNSRPNAVAFSKDGHDFVGMSTELVDGLRMRLWATLQDGTALTFLGMTDTGLAGHRLDEIASFTEALPSCALPTAAELAREVYARILDRIATEFLIHHELAHLVFGHVAYLKHRTGSGLLFELDESKGLDWLTSQTLEWDADSYATCESLRSVLRDVGRSFESIVMTRAFGSAHAALLTWLLSIYGLFWFFIDSGPVLEGMDSRSHPPAGTRQWITGACAASWLMSTEEPGARAMEAAFGTVLPIAISAVETSLELIRRPADPPQRQPANPHFMAMTTDDGRYYMSRYEERWTGLYNELQPFARMDLVKPHSKSV